MTFQHILLSRTDSIGDVILTLPLAGYLRKHYPGIKISFLGMPYTKAVIEACDNIDEFIDWNYLNAMNRQEAIDNLKSRDIDLAINVFPRKEIARLIKDASIALRVGTTGRWYNWLYCNSLVRMSRRKSNLHEAILNVKLMSRFIDTSNLKTSEIPYLYGLNPGNHQDDLINGLINKDRKNIILHPRSKGSAREWGLDNFAKLATLLSENYNVYITGTKHEGAVLHEEGFFDIASEAIDVTGKFSLVQFIQFINATDGLVAGSTGPLHIAAALGKVALGLYPPIQPMHPGRWAPLGFNADYLVADKQCNDCRNSDYCGCMKLISPGMVQQKLEAMVSNLSHNHID